MEVYLVYRQRKKTSWFGRESWGPRELVAVYGDETEAEKLLARWKGALSAHYSFSMEAKHVSFAPPPTAKPKPDTTRQSYDLDFFV